MRHRYAADVVIVGAGAAGLACAAEIVRRSQRRVLVLEARDRVGGRCATRLDPAMPVPIELGAEFIHGRSPAVLSLLQQSGGSLLEAERTRWTGDNGMLSQRVDLLPEITRAMRESVADLISDVTFDAFLTHTLSSKLSPAAVAFARLLVQGYDAADPARISAREVVAEWTGSGGTDDAVVRPLGGYQPLMQTLADQLAAPQARVQLSTQVTHVSWRRGQVDIGGVWQGAPYRVQAPQAVITLPVGVLKQPPHAPGAVHFMPESARRRAALEKISAGAVVRLVLRFGSAFWENLDGGRYRDVAFLRSARGTFPTFWTAFPRRAPLLVAWCGGPPAVKLSALPPERIAGLAIESLQSLFGEQVAVRDQYRDFEFHDWLQDPWCLGAYSSLDAGGEGAREALARPLRDTLFFAGEATDASGEFATVGGALNSGMRAAHELLALS